MGLTLSNVSLLNVILLLKLNITIIIIYKNCKGIGLNNSVKLKGILKFFTDNENIHQKKTYCHTYKMVLIYKRATLGAEYYQISF